MTSFYRCSTMLVVALEILHGPFILMFITKHKFVFQSISRWDPGCQLTVKRRTSVTVWNTHSNIKQWSLELLICCEWFGLARCNPCISQMLWLLTCFYDCFPGSRFWPLTCSTFESHLPTTTCQSGTQNCHSHHFSSLAPAKNPFLAQIISRCAGVPSVSFDIEHDRKADFAWGECHVTAKQIPVNRTFSRA